MQIRVFTADENGFIKIRPEDLELLLNDAYSEGYNQNMLTIGFQEPKTPPKDVVYPTWYEWLANMGVVPSEMPTSDALIIQLLGLLNTIPADIAQKLGIKPKGEE